jgi:preprotein translocase subunit YajC
MNGRITREQAAHEPWKYTAYQYQAAMGVHEPHIAEISPMQYAGLSKRGKAQYDAKRSAEWDASAACKQEWRALVMAAHDADAFNQHDPSTSDEARQAIAHEAQRRREAAAQFRFQEASHRNRITSADQVNVGDRVFSIMCGKYGRIVKKSKQSVRIELENAPAWMTAPVKERIGAIEWLSHNDLQASL